MKILARLFIGFVAAAVSFAAVAAVQVGEVAYSRGVFTGQIDGQPPRLIGKGSPLHNGETLNTGSRGFALLRFEDGTKMTLRPSTTFKVENINVESGSENALFSLIRGGLRAVTGFISKKAQNAFRVTTSVATIGIRGTEFDARLCAGDECQAEEDATGETAQRETRVVGRVALLRGKASAQEDGEQARALAVGAAIYERDQVQTGIKSFLVIAFNDETRVTLAPQSAFRVEEHEYKPEQPDENNSFFSFLQGGLRVVTGLVAQLNKKAVRIATPTATIGIRGTGFDLLCQGACVTAEARQDPAGDTLIGRLLRFFVRPAYAQASGDGMYAKVWQGSIELQLADQVVVLPPGRTAFLRNGFLPPQLVNDLPPLPGAMGGAPRPDRIPLEPDFFDETAQTTIEPGLYVKVDKGDVAVRGLDGRIRHVGRGEVVRAALGKLERLGFVPSFQKFDSTPRPGQFTTQTEQMVNLFGARGASQETMECQVK